MTLQEYVQSLRDKSIAVIGIDILRDHVAVHNAEFFNARGRGAIFDRHGAYVVRKHASRHKVEVRYVLAFAGVKS